MDRGNSDRGLSVFLSSSDVERGMLCNSMLPYVCVYATVCLSVVVLIVLSVCVQQPKWDRSSPLVPRRALVPCTTLNFMRQAALYQTLICHREALVRALCVCCVFC